ncbi:MAG TPA: hypothetical protein VFH70_00880 [Acidimicrobiales bacterium]|nr:hypothetical protein [Acidimicrobiales bacterium]
MLLLVTLALVVASAVLLILGFVQDALGFIYLSMLCAGVAALALFVFARLTKRRSAALVGAGVVAGVGSPYMPADEAPAEGFEPTSSVAAVAPAPVAEPVQPEPLRPEPAAVSAMAPAADEDPWAPEDTSDDWGDEILFPIEDYDELRVAEILPLLGQLEPDELQEVRDRELAGKARATILDRIDDRLNRRPAAVDAPASIIDTASLPAIEAAPEPAPAPAPRKRAATRTAKAEPAPAEEAPAARKATRTSKAAKATEPAMATEPAVATEPTPAPARARKAPAAKAAATAAPPAKAAPSKATAKAAGAAANSATSAAKKAAAPAKKAGAKTTKAATRATPAKRAAKKSQ